MIPEMDKFREEALKEMTEDQLETILQEAQGLVNEGWFPVDRDRRLIARVPVSVHLGEWLYRALELTKEGVAH